jgi:hypothetical protein
MSTLPSIFCSDDELSSSEREIHFGGNDVKAEEARIVEQFLAIVKSEDPGKKRRLAKINGYIHSECHPEINLVHMKCGYSVRCYMSCGSPAALQILYDSIDNGALTNTIEKIFRSLKSPVRVVKMKGRLKKSEQRQRIEQFNEHIGM